MAKVGSMAGIPGHAAAQLLFEAKCPSYILAMGPDVAWGYHRSSEPPLEAHGIERQRNPRIARLVRN